MDNYLWIMLITCKKCENYGKNGKTVIHRREKRMRAKCIDAIEKYKIITIIRGIYGEELLNSLEAMYRGGIRLAEITFDNSGCVADTETAENIAAAVKNFGDKMFIGAGTVTKASQVKEAKDAGAEYIVSPDVNGEIISLTRKYGMVSVPGAITPTEATTAVRSGADFVKWFPAGCFGPKYLKTVALPLSNIKFLAVGGVNAEDLTEYLNAGAVGFGISSGIVNKEFARKGEFDKIYSNAKKYTEILK